MKNVNDISQLEQTIKDRLEFAELEAPDVWDSISLEISNPHSGSLPAESYTLKEVLANLTFMLVVTGAMFYSFNDSPKINQDNHIVKSAIQAPAQETQTLSVHSHLQLNNTSETTTSINVLTQSTAQIETAPVVREVPDEEVLIKSTTEKQMMSSSKPVRKNGGERPSVSLGTFYNELLNIYLSDTQFCKNEICYASASNMQYFDAFHWEVNGKKIYQDQDHVHFSVSKPGPFMVSLVAVKDGEHFIATRKAAVHASNVKLNVYKLDDKQVWGTLNAENLNSVSWHSGEPDTDWQSASLNDIKYSYDHFGTYVIKVAVTSDQNCQDTILYPIQLDKEIKVSGNVISPSLRDGKNDFFEVEGEDIASYYLVIRDMAGNMVHESNNIDDKWDGINLQTGTVVPSGEYIYKIIYRQGLNDEKTVFGKLNIL